MSEPDLSAWVAALCGGLGLDPGQVDTTAVLDLARDAAHGIARPAAPVSAFLVGLAIGRGADPADAFAAATSLAVTWPG
ncbi:DUF6457 domain-containing protein [Frankia sp. AgPm24]|uniref:DUF6457 domain-containing protein n=1 Tax=Frankia sp. AgPm24 TaxID=631128 RepID=UPI00200BC3FC|nr:DUF6457 domain-containing protein [Frankia sp. AgPm24]MCK9920699.1 DUF6457 domain-containing protein [Frankia sp. AgPm24]